MLVKSHNDHASEFQMTMCMYFLACSVSRSLFNVLNHAGLTLSYMQAVAKLKQLRAEHLEEMHAISHTQTVMPIWDNLNITFNVREQCPKLHLCHKEPHVEHQVAIQMVACGKFHSLSLPASWYLPLLVCSGEPLRGKPCWGVNRYWEGLGVTDRIEVSGDE